MPSIKVQLRNVFDKLNFFGPAHATTSESFEKKSDFDSYVFLWKNSMEKLPVYTDENISFSKYFGFGSNMEYVKGLIGKPKFHFENGDANLNILVYIVDVHGHNVKFELHFYHRKLFSINYNYRYLGQEDRNAILESLRKKYHVSRTDDLKEHVILDPYGNGIIVNENDTFTVNYVSPNSQLSRITEAYMMSKKFAV